MVRVKSRYLLCEVNVSERSRLLLLDDRAVAAAVRAAVARTHGDYGAALCSNGFTGDVITQQEILKYLNAHTGIVFLRLPKRAYRLLWSALPFITAIETRGQKVSCFLNCLHVGGTIRTCQKFLIQYNKQQLHRMLPKCKNPDEEQKIRRAILNCSVPGANMEGLGDEEEEDEEE